MKRTLGRLTALGILFMPVIALAEDPDLGCYQRSYSAAHLRNNPAQVVEKIRLLFYRTPAFPEVYGALEVQMADQGQGHAAGLGGLVLRQDLICGTSDQITDCAVECDGGYMEVVRLSKEGLTFRTAGLVIGDLDGCGSGSDLAEVPGEYTFYRLETAPASVCHGMR